MKNATDITLVLDRSGSMASIRQDTIGGINQFIDGQKKQQGECRLTLIQFDTQNSQEIVFDNKPITEVSPLTEATFLPRAGTPLYDAVGHAIVHTGERLSTLSDNCPDKIIFVIITDGEENSSHEYSKDRVFDMIRHQTYNYNWQFVYIGANQDAMKVGASIGISPVMSMTYASNPIGTRNAYKGLTSNVAQARSGSGANASNNLSWTPEQRKKSAGKK